MPQPPTEDPLAASSAARSVEPADRNPALIELHEYWQSKRAGRVMPARRDIDPFDLRHILPNLMLVDVTYDPLRFRYRLFGTGLVQLYRREMTGKYLDEVRSPAIRAAAEAIYLEVLATRQASFKSLEFDIDDRYITFDRIILPLSNDGETVSMFLGAIIRRDFR